MRSSNIIAVLILMGLGLPMCFAQGKPKGDFLSKSIKLGQPVKYALSYHHNASMELFFPDSTYNYAPFEFIDKEYYPTQTTDSTSLDSVVYILRTFEVKKNQELSLPVFLIELGDTVQLFSSSDKIFVKQYLEVPPDSIDLQSDARYQTVLPRYNYPYSIAFLVIALLVGIASYFIFGKAIIRNYRLYMMYNNHVQFLRAFDKLVKELEKSPNLTAMEKVLGEWKNYLTKLEHKPINTFTTTEIISLFNKEDLKENLQEVDRSIYSGSINSDPTRALAVLKKFSNKRYKKRRKELRNAR